MKFGLLYYKDTDNIGDDVQTYAQKQFLPRVDYLIDRESLNLFVPNEKEYVATIMNAWYLHNKAAWPPSPYIKPLLTSMHFSVNPRLNGGDDYIRGEGAEYLKKYGPVGCRDEETIKRLNGSGVPTYFSGCMTLTIKPFLNLERKDYICAVDVDEKILEKIKLSTNREVKVITHKVNPEEIVEKTFEQRMLDVEELLKMYQQAHVVITSRLHTMLPSIALGTPTILIHKVEYERDRLETFLKYADTYVDTEFLEMDISDILENPKPNNQEYLEITNNLNKICNEFIENSKNEELHDVNELPEIEEYNKIIPYLKHNNNLYEKAWRQSLSNILKMDGYFKQLQDANIRNEKLQTQLNKKEEESQIKLNELNTQLEQLKQINLQLNDELNRVYNSKTFKVAVKMRKFLKRK